MISKFRFSIASLVLIIMLGICYSCGNKSTEQKKQPTSCGVIVNVSESIPRYDGNIPENAEPIVADIDWKVYMEEIETLDCYSACKLYLENDISHGKYLLLETRGQKQEGTKLPIKARNKLAYGCDEVGYKEVATYEDGYIQAVEYIIMLTPTKILLEGSPDCHNMYSYILDIESYSAIHVEAYSGFSGMVFIDGVDYLDFFNQDYSSGVRQTYLERYDLSGNLVHREPYEEEE